MSDYSKTTSFGAKDSLTTGDPNKIIKGSELDTEFDAIATASATKFDSGDIASEAQAIAGTSDATVMSPAKVRDVIFAGSLNANGTERYLPDGWSAAKTGTGTYKVTHSLGLDAVGDLMIVACSRSATCQAISVVAETTDTFSVVTEDEDDAAIDASFYFVAIRVA